MAGTRKIALHCHCVLVTSMAFSLLHVYAQAAGQVKIWTSFNVH